MLGVQFNSGHRITTLAFAVACAFAACARSSLEPIVRQSSNHQTLYVIAAGWHTEIGIAADAISGPLTFLWSRSPNARYIVFGWGQRDYYMSPNPGFGELVKAAIPAPSVMLIIPLEESPAKVFTVGARVFTIPVSREGLNRLSQFLWDHLDQGQGPPRPIGDGPYRQSSFYDATGTYSLVNTCNTWTADALGIAGLPVRSSGVVFARQVVDQVRRLATAPGGSQPLQINLPRSQH